MDPVKQAIAAGYTWKQIADYHEANGMDPPPRASLSDIYSPPDLNRPGRDAINEGAGPIGEAAIGLAAGGVVAGVRAAASAMGGAIADDAAAAVSSRASQMGVSTTVPEDVVAPVTEDEAGNLLAAKVGGAAIAGGAIFFDKLDEAFQ